MKEESSASDQQLTEKVGKKKGQPMTPEEVGNIMQKFITNALNYANSNLSTQRAEAIRDYYGKEYGDEDENHSSVISREVLETVEWMMPVLIETFVGSGNVVQFAPVDQQDVAAAKQETDYINYVFFRDNPGFLNLYSWIKDALIQKNGIIKFVPREKEKVETDTYEGLTQLQYLQLMMQCEAENLPNGVTKEAIEHTEREETILQPSPVNPLMQIPVKQTLHDLKIKVTKKQMRLEIFCIPPEEFLVAANQQTLSLRDAQCSIHYRDMTISELKSLGFDEEQLEEIPTSDFPAAFPNQQEWLQRQYLNDTFINRTIYTDSSMRPLKVAEGYLYIDYDGDGFAELRQVFYANGKVLTKKGVPAIQEFEVVPFAAITPNILAHQFYGLSIADMTRDLQLIKTQLWRQMLDNIYLTNNNRHVVNENVVEIEDLYESRPGQIIRCQVNPSEAIMPLQVQDVSSGTYQMMEYLDKVMEARTGVSQNTTGLNPDILNNNKGDASVWRLMTTATQRINLIARVFAETGFKDLFLSLHQLSRKYQDIQRMVNLENEWVNVNPSDWKDRQDLIVQVGVGTGDKDVLRQAYMLLGQAQQMLLQGGKANLVTDSNIYNLISKTADTFNIKDIDNYFTNPQSQQGQQISQQMQQNASQNPALMAEQAKMQLTQMEMAHKEKLAQMDAQLQMTLEQSRADIEGMKLQQKQFSDLLKASLQDSALHLENARTAIEESKHIKDSVQQSHDMMMNMMKEIRENSMGAHAMSQPQQPQSNA